MVAFLLAKPFFYLDNPDCSDFRATCCSDLLVDFNTSFFISFFKASSRGEMEGKVAL